MRVELEAKKGVELAMGAVPCAPTRGGGNWCAAQPYPESAAKGLKRSSF